MAEIQADKPAEGKHRTDIRKEMEAIAFSVAACTSLFLLGRILFGY